MESTSNGRVNILGNNRMDQFRLYDRIPVNSKDDFKNQALIGGWEKNELSDAFFSIKNIEILQNDIREGVFKQTNGRFLISKQDESTLKIIMRSVFLQHSKNLRTHIREQIYELNKIITDYAIPQIIGEANSYIKYKHDSSKMYTPMSLPTATYNDKTLELKPWF
mgnify:CR=1 FL=1